MKTPIVFFTHDSLYSARLLRDLIAIPEVSVKAVVVSACVMQRGGSVIADSLRLVKRSGIKYALYQAIVTGGYPVLLGRYRQQRLSTIAKQAGIKWFTTADVNANNTLNFLKDSGCGKAVSCYFNQRFKPSVIELFPDGIINVHPSLLPHNRGVDPLFYARLRQESSGGVTLHYIDDQLDTGPIIAQAVVPLWHTQSLISEQLKTFEQGSRLLADYFSSKTMPKALSQQVDSGNYDSWPQAKQVAKVPYWFFAKWSKKSNS